MRVATRTLRLAALSLGFIGLIACSLALVGVWKVAAGLRETTGRLFDKFDSALEAVQGRAVQTRERLEASKVTAEEISQRVQDWTRREAVDRVALRLDVEAKTERLETAMQQADEWLDFAASSVELMQRALSMASSAGAPADPAAADGLVEDLALVRTKLAEAADVRERHPRLYG